MGVVFIRREHVHRKSLFHCPFGNGTDDVVGLKTGHFQNGNIHAGEELFDVGNGQRDVFGLFLPLGFVGLKLLVAEGRSRKVETHTNVAGFFFVEDFEKGIGKSENRTGVESPGVDAWIFAEGKVGPVNKGHGVDQEEFFHVPVEILPSPDVGDNKEE